MGRYFRMWSAFTEPPVRFYGIAIVLGAIFVAGGTIWRSWLGVALMLGALFGLLLLVAPLYERLWDDDDDEDRDGGNHC